MPLEGPAVGSQAPTLMKIARRVLHVLLLSLCALLTVVRAFGLRSLSGLGERAFAGTSQDKLAVDYQVRCHGYCALVAGRFWTLPLICARVPLLGVLCTQQQSSHVTHQTAEQGSRGR